MPRRENGGAFLRLLGDGEQIRAIIEAPASELVLPIIALAEVAKR